MSIATRSMFAGPTNEAAPSRGTWSADGSPDTIDSGTEHKAFPGVAWLDASRVLLVYRHGTSHLAGGDIVARIGTVTGTSVSWASEFTIYDHASDDLRCEDAVSVIEGSVVVAGRHYAASVNHDPFVLICDDSASTLGSTSTWTKYDITFSEGSVQNATQGHVLQVRAKYVLAMAAVDSGPTYECGVILNDSLTDWTSPTWKSIGTGYTEVGLTLMWDGTLQALLRTETGSETYRSVSHDGGSTWSAPALAHDGFGFPVCRRFDDAALLSVYRDAPDGDTAWRTSTDHGKTWSSETILDTTGTRSVYASVVQLDTDDALCVYAVEGTGGGSATDADLYSQVFSRT